MTKLQKVSLTISTSSPRSFTLNGFIALATSALVSLHYFQSGNFVIMSPSAVKLLHEKFLQFDWLRAVVFQLNLKYLRVKITNLLLVVV